MSSRNTRSRASQTDILAVAQTNKDYSSSLMAFTLVRRPFHFIGLLTARLDIEIKSWSWFVLMVLVFWWSQHLCVEQERKRHRVYLTEGQNQEFYSDWGSNWRWRDTGFEWFLAVGDICIFLIWFIVVSLISDYVPERYFIGAPILVVRPNRTITNWDTVFIIGYFIPERIPVVLTWGVPERYPRPEMKESDGHIIL